MSSTPFPAPRDLDGLLAFVNSLGPVSASQAVSHVDVALVLSWTLLDYGPGPATRANWNDKLRKLQLEALQHIRLGVSAEGAFSAHAKLDAIVLPRLLVFLHSMERWASVQFPEDVTVTPSYLRDLALDVAVELLARLGEDLPNRDEKAQRGWEILSYTISTLLLVVQELRTLTAHSLPAVVNISKDPYVLDSTSVTEDPFGTSPNQEASANDNQTVKVENRAQLMNLAITILVIISRALRPECAAVCFMQAQVKLLQEEVSNYANLLVAAQLNTRTVHLFSRIVECMQHHCASERPARQFERHVTRVLIRRVKEGPSLSLLPLDRAVVALFENSSHTANLAASLVAVDILQQASWVSDQTAEAISLMDTLYACIWRSSVLFDQQLNGKILATLARLPTSQKRRQVEEQLSLRLNTPTAILPQARSEGDRLSISIIIASLGLDVPMESELTLTRCLEFIKAAAEDMSMDQDVLVKSLHRLALLARTNDERCSMVPTYVAVVHAMQPIAQTESQRLAFDSIRRAIQADGDVWNVHVVDSCASLARQGLKAPSRCVRLSAGEMVLEIAKQRERCAAVADVIFWCDLLEESLNDHQDCVRETSTVTIGSLGRIEAKTSLIRSLRCLTLQLSEKNILLRGLACLQLRNLAVHRNRSFYTIVSPFLPELACLVVSKLKTAPLMLLEFCRLLGLKPSDFLAQTLPYTLPALAQDLDATTLEKISQDLSRSLPTLILSNAHLILARAFLSNRSDAIFDFVLAQLHKDALPRAQVKGDTFVRSCVLALVCELVCGLGDTQQMEGRNVMIALEKVQRKLAPPTSGQQKKATATLSTFLQTYLLGIMTHFNDLLHDLRGRKTIEDKDKLLHSLGSFFGLIGPPVYQVAHQAMALLQSTIKIDTLSEASVGAWYKFLLALSPTDIGPYVGPLSAAIVTSWPHLNPIAQKLAQKTLEHCVVANREHVAGHVDKIVDLTGISLLEECARHVAQMRAKWNTRDTVQHLLQRCAGENLAVTTQSLLELKRYIKSHNQEFLSSFASGDVFDPLVSHTVDILLTAAALDGEDAEPVHLTAFEILGMLGALDPDRFESQTNENTFTLLQNFDDLQESTQFAIHLIEELLVPAFRSTSDPRFQTTTGFAIQELSKFCGFTADLDRIDGRAVKQSVRQLWNQLTQTARDTVAPFRGAKFVVQEKDKAHVEPFPIYPSQSSYRDWLQTWAAHLLSRVSSPAAKSVFSSCRGALRGNDARVALFLIPHLVLHILISGTDEDREAIRTEIAVVLEDLVTPSSGANADRRTFSAQMIFTLLDHLNRWVRHARQYSARANDARRRKAGSHLATALEERVLSVHSVLSSIDRTLMARAAFECKAYARALMNLEQQVLERRQAQLKDDTLRHYYEQLHEIYCLVDEPDGMEGISTLMLSPSMEVQIRQHESTGKWTAAQSCWEVQLQQSPNELSLHSGLLRCLRNLGHYDTLRTHIQGVLTRNPEWKDDLAGFELESAWIVRDWEHVKAVSRDAAAQTAESTMARLLLTLRAEDEDEKRAAFATARLHLGAPVTAAGRGSYRRSYDAVMNLHIVHELELIQHEFVGGRAYEPSSLVIAELTRRFDAVLPTFRTQESLLNMRRTAFGLSLDNTVTPTEAASFTKAIGKSWLLSAKIARKAGHHQTAYSALLQASQNGATFAYIQSCKLTKDNGDTIKALSELTAELVKHKGATGDEPLDPALHHLTVHEKQQLAKAMVLRARWMQDTARYTYNDISKQFVAAVGLCKDWESAYFHFGHYQDEWQRHINEADRLAKAPAIHMQTVQNYASSLEYGSKYIYQTMPRMLTLWLDMGEEKGLLLAEKEGRVLQGTSKYSDMQRMHYKMTHIMQKACNSLAVYKWFTAFPQIVSRVEHPHKTVSAVLTGLIVKIIAAYPQQGLWSFMSVPNSKNENRSKRGRNILQQIQNRKDKELNELVRLAEDMTVKLLELCDFSVGAEPPTMSGNFPELLDLPKLSAKLILPFQEFLTATLPPRGAVEREHLPFPPDLPLICGFEDEIEIMKSMQKPRRISIIAQNGQRYMMMAKPKDDLRKDARLMDFNTIINKLLRTKSESRRRQLHIRTYSVVTLNEECGLLQWVPNTTPIRIVLNKLYDARGISTSDKQIHNLLGKLKEAQDVDAAKIFTTQLLPLLPPVMHEWFLDSFPDPSAWLASRMAYSRTAAVISLVGYVLGLGDRHAENILIDQVTGDFVHVDFNMLFERGKSLETPERVPFRLTQNVVDGMGITGTEGVFRIACELVMRLLRDYKDCLMNVLEAFIHDPLVEWDEDRKRRDRQLQRVQQRGPPGQPHKPEKPPDIKAVAKIALRHIQRKLSGMQAPNDVSNEKIISTADQVAVLISEASDPRNLSKMYQGWAPHL